MGAMKRTILWLSVLLAMAGTAPASAAFLGANPRLGESFLNTGIEQVAGDVSLERLPGSGGAWLRRAAEFFVAPSTAGPLSRNLMAADDLTAQFSSRIDPLPGYYDVRAHGGPTSVDVFVNGQVIEGVNHRVLARLIQNSPDYAGQNVRLLSCNTGSLPNGFAKNLANKMNVDVVAPNQLLFPQSNGKFIIAEGRTIGGVTYPIFPARGKMVPFSPGKP
jgi:hypothetical protein